MFAICPLQPGGAFARRRQGHVGVFWTRFRFRRGQRGGRWNCLFGISGRRTADLSCRDTVSRALGCEEGGEASCKQAQDKLHDKRVEMRWRTMSGEERIARVERERHPGYTASSPPCAIIRPAGLPIRIVVRIRHVGGASRGLAAAASAAGVPPLARAAVQVQPCRCSPRSARRVSRVQMRMKPSVAFAAPGPVRRGAHCPPHPSPAPP